MDLENAALPATVLVEVKIRQVYHKKTDSAQGKKTILDTEVSL